MNNVVSHAALRALRACRSIEKCNGQIIHDLNRMRCDTKRAVDKLEDASNRLEESMGHFDEARERLEQLSSYHDETMREVEKIMANSPAFEGLR